MPNGGEIDSPASPPHRIFLAFTPDSEVRERLDALAGRCREQSGGRRIPVAKLHLTLLFVGQARAAQIESVAALAAECPAPAALLPVDRVGFWERGGIVWAGCRECPASLTVWVGELHGRARRMGFNVEPRPFEPHVTLLRHAQRRPRIHIESFPWRLGTLSLYESRTSSGGSEYRELRSWPTAPLADVK